MFLDLPGLEKFAQAEIVHAGIVGNRGQVLHALADKGIDKIGGNPAQPETAHHDH